jgi:type III secretion protein Q
MPSSAKTTPRAAGSAGARNALPGASPQRPQLAAVDERALPALNHLLGPAALSDLAALPLPSAAAPASLQWRWQAGPPLETPALSLLLDAEGLRCALAFEADDGPALDEGIDLTAFDDAALLLAATLRYAAPLAHLDRITGRRFVLAQLRRGVPCALEGAVQSLRFSVADPRQPQRVLRGELRFPLAQSIAWQMVQGRSAPHAALLRLPLRAGVWLTQRLTLPRAELQRLRAGGALLLGVGRPDDLACELRWPGTAWPAQLQANSLRLHPHARADLDNRSPPMSNDTPAARAEANTPAGTPADSASALNTMPVTLEFHIGQISLPLAELPAALAAGYVIGLNRPLDGDAVTVRANGHTLAYGELVQVGDHLAVRIARIAQDDGSV